MATCYSLILRTSDNSFFYLIGQLWLVLTIVESTFKVSMKSIKLVGSDSATKLNLPKKLTLASVPLPTEDSSSPPGEVVNILQEHQTFIQEPQSKKENFHQFSPSTIFSDTFTSVSSNTSLVGGHRQLPYEKKKEKSLPSKGAPKKIQARQAGGETWIDSTLEEWDESTKRYMKSLILD